MRSAQPSSRPYASMQSWEPTARLRKKGRGAPISAGSHRDTAMPLFTTTASSRRATWSMDRPLSRRRSRRLSFPRRIAPTLTNTSILSSAGSADDRISRGRKADIDMTARILFSGLLLAGCCLSHAFAAEQAVSFEHKRINLLIGFSPTGFGYDTYGRVLARYLGKYLPGNPSVVPQNRPGAGSLSLMNQTYNIGAKDGTDIALVGRGAAMDPLVSGAASGAKFDATKFNWIGSMNNEVAGFFLSDKAPAKTLNEILAGTSISVGSTGAGGDPQVFARALNGVLNTDLKAVSGYPGMNVILLGIARGELDGVLGYSWGVAR